MDFSSEIITQVLPWAIPLVILSGGVAALFALHVLLLGKRLAPETRNSLLRQLVMLALTGTLAVAVIVALPVAEGLRNQLLQLLGLVVTGVIALSSTSFVGNAMAGLMLRAVHNFRPGDFLKVGEHFGRVSERGLLHTEIQTEDRDLTTLPNLYLVTNPMTVVRYSGTIVSAEVSLGYDVPRARAEELLKEAAEKAELEEPFVQVTELGDFSVTYRVAGFLKEVRYLISARSSLRKAMLDALHGGAVEIVSPTFMNQRQIPESRRFIPRERSLPEAEPESFPEYLIFDKAQKAESREQVKEHLSQAREQLEALKKERTDAADEAARERLSKRIAAMEKGIAWLSEQMEKAEEGSTP